MVCLTHLEPDTLECEVKWALGSIATNKASGGGYSVCPTVTAAGQHTAQRPQGSHRFLWPSGDFLSMIRKTSGNLPCESDTMALTLFLSRGDG